MTLPTNIVKDVKLVELIREAFQKRIEQIVEGEVEKSIQELRRKIPEVVSGLALELFNEFDLMENRERVMITIRKRYEK